MDLKTPNDSLIIARIKNILGSHDLPESNLSITKCNDDRLLLRIWLNEDSGNRRLLDELTAVEGVTGTEVDVENA